MSLAKGTGVEHSETRGSIIGVDVGGTFTDLVMVDSASGTIRIAKTPTTLDNQAFGVLAALQQAEVDLGEVGLIVHGTTTTTNAVLERKLSRTGLITTAGFRDVLELGRRTRPQAYGMKGQFTPIIPRDLRLEVPERMDAQGNVLIPLDEDALRAAIRQLIDTGCEALVIHFLHAYANPAHELRAAEIAAETWPNSYITTGHSLLSESREFERGVTAAVNASVQPLLERYVARLRDELAAKGYRGDVLVMNGNGGMVSSRLVAREAAKTVMSGPASGVMAAAYTGRRASEPNLLTYDMGGTSTDVALIRDGTPPVSNEIEVEYAMPIHVPMVDVRTVGAGGGSIARVNAAGLLEVGPESAGADPGPICYGKGGTRPTISDANMLLGRLNTAKLNAVAGGVGMAELAAVFARELGAPLGVDAHGAADAVIRMANAKMAGAIRMVSLSLGADPRDFALFAFGGAGPLHAAALARELGVPRVLVPARPGITNALGCAVADLRHDFVQTLNQPLDDLDIPALHAAFAGQLAEGQAALARENVTVTRVEHHFSADMQFLGQSHVVRVPLADATPTAETLRSRFNEVYWQRFKVALPEIRARIVNVNCSVIGVCAPVDLSRLIDAAGRQAHATPTGHRSVYFDGSPHDTPIYWRDHLPADVTLDGPAIIEQLDCTTLIPPGDRVTGGVDGNLMIHIGAAE
ncbi:hydantoinase/oxoprolinase family protein [Sulfitobacter sp. PR48]|uniref:hydantoinase/oxoprolinase family protein n=1 Tax=Sulfitobacter sp. PR48 TaxID=3028383 RepID=UPI00237BBD76|nr:hydantoinase/oxoprolinase family protein [Sulfitobacter sp. PR48]MDD9721822.1 hydantoinase/oxoprolinase family protein [Sulfitobacter sp. PR48]